MRNNFIGFKLKKVLLEKCYPIEIEAFLMTPIIPQNSNWPLSQSIHSNNHYVHTFTNSINTLKKQRPIQTHSVKFNKKYYERNNFIGFKLELTKSI